MEAGGHRKLTGKDTTYWMHSEKVEASPCRQWNGTPCIMRLFLLRPNSEASIYQALENISTSLNLVTWNPKPMIMLNVRVYRLDFAVPLPTCQPSLPPSVIFLLRVLLITKDLIIIYTLLHPRCCGHGFLMLLLLLLLINLLLLLLLLPLLVLLLLLLPL